MMRKLANSLQMPLAILWLIVGMVIIIVPSRLYVMVGSYWVPVRPFVFAGVFSSISLWTSRSDVLNFICAIAAALVAVISVAGIIVSFSAATVAVFLLWLLFAIVAGLTAFSILDTP